MYVMQPNFIRTWNVGYSFAPVLRWALLAFVVAQWKTRMTIKLQNPDACDFVQKGAPPATYGNLIADRVRVVQPG